MSQKKQAAREFSAEFKLNAVRRALAGEPIRAIAAELEIRRKLIYAWKDLYAELGEAGLARPRGRPKKLTEPPPQEPSPGRGELLAARRRIAELERKVGQQELELDFFADAWRRVQAVRKAESEKPSADRLPREPGKAT